MSNRTLIELNHDYGPEICTPDILNFLRRYINCAGREEVEALEAASHYGIRVIAMRHHADSFHIPPNTPGFKP